MGGTTQAWVKRAGVLGAMLCVTVASAAEAQATPEAEAALAEAASLERVDADAEALAALDRAVELAPSWPVPWLARARFREARIDDTVQRAALRFEAQVDYPAAIALVEAALADLQRALAIPGEPLADAATRRADLSRLLTGLRRQDTTGREEARVVAEAEAQRREAALRAEKLAAFQQLQKRYEGQRREAERNRFIAWGLGGAGVASVVASIGLFAGSQVVIGDIKEGRLATGSLYEEAARSAGGLQTASLLLGLLGAGLLGGGGYFFVTSAPPTAPSPVTLHLAVSTSGAVLSGTW